MRCLVRTNDKWQTEHPDNLSAWLWQHDGKEAVAIDGDVFYCGTEALAQQYRDKWAGERKRGDKRRVADFLDLDRQLFARETPIMPDQAEAWCESGGCACSEIVDCTGACLE